MSDILTANVKVISLQVVGAANRSRQYQEVFEYEDRLFRITIFPRMSDAYVDVWSKRDSEWHRVHSILPGCMKTSFADGPCTAADFKKDRDELARVAFAVVFS